MVMADAEGGHDGNESYTCWLVRHIVPRLGGGSELTDLGASEISRNAIREKHHKAAVELEASRMAVFSRAALRS
jgi:hypothetical protein